MKFTTESIRRLWMVGLGATIVCPMAASSQQRTPLMDTLTTQSAIPAARDALSRFGQAVTRQNAASLGFDSPDQIGRATLGIPIQELMIRLDQLRQFSQNQSPLMILRNTDRVSVPVLLNNVTRSSVTVTKESGTWTMYSLGSPTYARSLDALGADLSRREGLAANAYFEVRVPALNVAFIGRSRGNDLFFSPVSPDSRFGFVRGQTMLARDALARMVNATRAHNGNPT